MPRVPGDVFRDVRGAAPPGALDDVLRAYTVAGEALHEGRVSDAVRYLEWAKEAAPRSAVVREALGVAHYTAGDYAAAHSELLAYRRLSSRQDQNHLLADCARALGRPEKVVEYVNQMKVAEVGRDRVVEGLLVLAGARADAGDARAALATLERADLEPATIHDYHPRLWYLAADLCVQLGQEQRARDYLEAILAVDPGFLDAAQRLGALDG